MVKQYMKKILNLFLGRGAGAGSPAVGKINFGDFGRLTPISDDWGFKRGGPVDRVFIEGFLSQHSPDIKGHALEVLDSKYLDRYGAGKVNRKDILDINPENPNATIVTDLSKADSVPSGVFDCFVFTQTLHLIYDLHAAMGHIYRILKPGGVLLMTVPGISHFPCKNPRYWAFTEFSVRRLLEEQFPKDNIMIEVHGNVLASAAFLYGVGAGELTKDQYDFRDRNYQMIITARAQKSG